MIALVAACEPPGREHREVPEPWFQPAPELDAYLEWLGGSAYREVEPDRSLRSLAVFEGDLFVGVGDLESNPGSRYCPDRGAACDWEDQEGHGLPLLRVRAGSESAEVVAVLREESIARFRAVGGTLWIPGLDPTEGDEPLACQRDGTCPEEDLHPHPISAVGHVHAFDGEGVRTTDLPGVVHALALEEHGGALHAALVVDDRRSSADGEIRRSVDDGRSWTVDHVEPTVEGDLVRLGAFLPLGDELHALGYGLRSREPIRLVRTGAGWVPDHLLANLPGQVEVASVGTGALAWRGDRARVVGVGPAGSSEEAPTFLAPGAAIRSVHVADGQALVLEERPGPAGGWRYRVLATDDLLEVDVIRDWHGEDRISSVVGWDGDLVFGGDRGWLFR